MYRVTIYNGDEATIIHEPTVRPEDPHLYAGTLVQGSSGEIDSLTMELLPNNPGYDLLSSRTTLVQVLDTSTDEAIFTGRVLTITPQMEDSGLIYKTVVCEDRLGYLCDSIQPYTPEATYTLEDFFALLLANHNAQVEDYKKIYPGNISMTTGSGNVTKGLNYETTWECIKSKLLDSVGGEIQLYVGADGLLYLDYVEELGSIGTATIALGKNMQSITREIDPTSVITRLIPLGAKNEISEDDPNADTEERLTIASVNGGVIYLDDEDAQAVYGIVEGIVEWEDVTEPANLLTKAKAWLEAQTVTDQITLTAVDLYLAGLESAAIERYNYYLVSNELIGLNTYYRVAKVTRNICNPTEITYEMGSQSKSLASVLTDASGKASSAAADAAAAVNAQIVKTVNALIVSNATITNLLADVADIDAAYITMADVTTLLADYATISSLSAEYLTASDANLTYATISDLTTATANITDLSADVANITTILAGNIGTGNLQTVHLTGENVVIDDAVITSAMIADLSASKLTAGTIYTDKVTIQSESGNLYITDNTIQIQDGATVRVQIGEDASGDYNLYLWDAAGNLLWDAGGLYAAGIHDGIIRDIAVADDAAISGSKLDIASVASELNADGSLTVDAANITIDNTTLDVAYTTITSNTAAAQSAAAEAQAAAQAAQSTADDAASAAATAASDAATAQSTADNAATAAANAQTAADDAQIIAGNAQEAADAAQATADQAASDLAQAQADLKTAQDNYAALAEQADATDEELAAAQKAIADAQSAVDTAQATADAASTAAANAQTAADAAQADATAAQTAADTAATAAAEAQSTADMANETASIAQEAADAAQATADDAAAAAAELETRTTTLETELEVVQGQITAKVWQTDITEAISGISVGARNLLIQSGMTDGYRFNSDGTAYASAYSSITDYTEISADEVTYSVHCVYTNESDCYFQLCFYDSDKNFISRPLMYTAVTTKSKSAWTVDVPSDAAYFRAALPTSIKDYVKLEIGTVATDWTPAPEDTETAITTLNDQYAQLTLDLNSITLSVGDLTTTVSDQGTSITEITGELSLKVDKDDNEQIVSMINASANEICITGDRLVIESSNFTLTADGKITCTDGEFSGKIIASSGTIGGWLIDNYRLYAELTALETTTETVYVTDDDGNYIQETDGDGNPLYYTDDTESETTTEETEWPVYQTEIQEVTSATGYDKYTILNASKSTGDDIAISIGATDPDDLTTGAIRMFSSGYIYTSGSIKTDIDLTAGGHIYCHGDCKLTNGHAFMGRTIGGKLVNIGQVNKYNQVILGSASYPTYLYGSAGNIVLNGKIVAGTTAVYNDGVPGVQLESGGNIIQKSSGSPNIYFFPNGTTSSPIRLIASSSGLSLNNSFSVTGNGSFSGSLSTYGFTVPEILRGTTSVTLSATSGTQAVTFSKTFSGTPTVVVSPQHASTTTITARVYSKSTTGFTFYYTSSSTGGTVVFNWIAMYI